MKKLALLVVMTSQIMVGADSVNFPQQALDVTRQHYQSLMKLAQDEQAVAIICRVKGRDLTKFIEDSCADIDQMEQQFKENKIAANDLYNEMIAMNENVYFLRRLVAQWDNAEQLIANAAQHIDRLFVVGQNQEIADIISKKMGVKPETLAKNLLLALSQTAEQFENGMIVSHDVKDITIAMIGCADELINQTQKKSLCIQKGEHEKKALGGTNI